MKRLKLFLIICISFISGILLTNNVYSNYYSSNVVSNTTTSSLVKSNSIAMMLETDIDSEEYYLSTETSWPKSGYVFNESLSKCENGATLSWDSENNQVLMTGNSSDKCYIYFDLDDTYPSTPTFSNKTVSESEVTITVSSTDEESGISSITCYYGDDENSITTEGEVNGTTCTVPSTATYMKACVTNGSGLESCANKQLATYFIKDGKMLVEFSTASQSSSYSVTLTSNDGYLTIGPLTATYRMGIISANLYDFSIYNYYFVDASFSFVSTSSITSGGTTVEFGADNNQYFYNSSTPLPGAIIGFSPDESQNVERGLYSGEEDYNDYTSSYLVIGKNAYYGELTINIYNIWFQLSE